MPKFETLAEEEVKRYTSTNRQANLAPYIEYLAGLSDGDYGRIVLEEGDNKPTVKNRLNRATERLGIVIEYRRANKESVIFKVLQTPSSEPAEATTGSKSKH